MSSKSKSRQQFEELFAIDYRALAVFRILVASVAILTALFQMKAAASGIIDGHLPVWEWALMAVAGVVLATGHFKTLTSFLLWVFLCRYCAAGGGDVGTYMTIIAAMWSVFLPTDRYLTWKRADQFAPAKSYASLATMAILLQVFFIYFSAGVTKNFEEWLFNATAIRDLTHTEFVSPLGRTLLSSTWVSSLLSVMTIAIEVSVPFLMFISGPRLPVLRTLGVLAVVGMHIGMILTMTLSLIPFISIGFWILFIPSQVWDRIWKLPTMIGAHTEQQRLCNWIAAPLLAGVMLSATLSWVWPMDNSGTLQSLQDSIPKMGIYQQWRMFNTPSQLRRAAEEAEESFTVASDRCAKPNLSAV